MKRTTRAKLLNYIISAASIILLLLCFETWRGKGILIWVLAMVVIACMKIWARRDYFMALLRYTETVIWGKPLDKELWEKGEFKNTKVKLVWRKKKNDKTKLSNNKERQKKKPDKV